MRYQPPDRMPRFWEFCAGLFALVLVAGAVVIASAWLLGAGWVM